MSTWIAVAAFVMLVLGSAMEAGAKGWIICNRTAEPLDVAIAYHDGANGWLTEGWWTVQACGGCARVMDHSQTDGVNVFLTAVTSGGSQRVGSEARFCVSDHAKGARAWTGRSGKVCGPGYISRPFNKHVVDTEGDFTTDITGKVAGKVCRH